MPSFLCCQGGYKPGKELWVCTCGKSCACTCDNCLCGNVSKDLL
jgi:hypothetical protein